jgi:1,4-dihydroxy-2-naphthoate octaprenyltransferase
MSSEAGSLKRSAADKLTTWIYALRAPFLTASALPVVVGASAAYWKTGGLAWDRLVASLGGVVCLHLSANLANDYFDYMTGCDDLNPQPTPFSGGSRVIQRGLISGRAILTASGAFCVLAAIQGLWLNAAMNHIRPGNTLLWLGLAGIAGGLAYSAGPLRLSYRGAGEAVVFALFGPLVVAGSYFCQTGHLGSFPLLASLPAGLLVLAILVVNEVLDVDWDALAGKRTLVVRLGKRRGFAAYLAAYLGAYAWLGAGILAGIYPPPAVAAFAPLVILRCLLPGSALRDRAGTINASRLTVISHTVSAGLIAVSYFLDRVL